MFVKSCCNYELVTCDKHMTVTDVASLMRDNHVGSVIVVERRNGFDVPVGIITDRDIVIEIISRGLEGGFFKVGDIMHSQVVTIGENKSVTKALNVMRTNGIRRLPVVDENTGELKGIVTMDDLISHLASNLVGIDQIIINEQKEESYLHP